MDTGRELPLVVLYLYVHARNERFVYPNARVSGSARRVAVRYLECAVTQAASLRLQGARCDVALASNGVDRVPLGRRGRRLLDALGRLDVELLEAPYEHRPPGDHAAYISSRYVFDAILAAADAGSPERPLWLTDLDCVWARPEAMLSALPSPPSTGCLFIDYPPDWNTLGSRPYGSRREIAELAGAGGELPRWIGGELLAGTAATLRALVAEAEHADAELAEQGAELATEEQLLTLMGAQGRARFEDLSRLGRRLQTGWRHEAEPVEGASELAFWHLPAEKGLSLRRAASEISRGRSGRLAAELADRDLAARRFRVTSPSPPRIARDSAWLLGQRARRRLSPGSA
jgi:hypothetical protein